MGGKVSKKPIRISPNATAHHTRKETSRRRHARWSAAHVTSHAMIATLAFPTSGPAGFHQFKDFWILVLTSANNVHKPSTTTPRLAAMIAATAEPFVFSN
jgi:hypothetical protein